MLRSHPPSPRCATLVVPLAIYAALLGALAAWAQESTPAPGATQSAAQAPAFDPQSLPDVVAKVNGREITRAELIDEAQGAYSQFRQIGQTPALDAAFFRGALDQRIASMLLEVEAKNQGIAATPDEIEQRLAQARSSFDSPEEFQHSLETQGLTVEGARDELAQEISRYKYIEAVILPEIKIADEALRSFYDQNLERMKMPERLKLRHILIEVASDASEQERTQARERVDSLLARARAGEDFGALARASSDDGTRDQGGELPWVQRGQTLPAFEQAAFALDKGGLSDVVETALGFHIIQSLDRQAPRTSEFDEVKDRILAILQSERVQQGLRQKVEGWMAKADIQRFGL